MSWRIQTVFPVVLVLMGATLLTGLRCGDSGSDWPDFDEESGMPYGHTSATEIDFENDLQGWIPLATIGEEESQVLLCRVDDPVCPVGMWEHETNSVVAVADSLDDFLASLVDADD